MPLKPDAEVAVESAVQLAQRARTASTQLASLSGERRRELLEQMAVCLDASSKSILSANSQDVESAAQMVARGEMSSSLADRLKLDDAKWAGVLAGVRQVAAMADPLGRVELARELDNGLCLYQTRCPIGVVLVIFESRPDALVQIVSLLIKSGNAGILKGGSEAKRTNQAIMEAMLTAIERCRFPQSSYTLVSGREQVAELLKQERLIDLVIPRGSNQLVRDIQNSTRVPVLGHAEGICHLYVHEDADLDMALQLAIDAKTNYPAACNSIETLLVNEKIAPAFLPGFLEQARDKKTTVRMTAADALRFGITTESGAQPAKIETPDTIDWATEYSDLVLALKVVDSLPTAVEHINHYGSGHTDAIVTASKDAFDLFFAAVNSAGVYWNASTRFADGFRYGFGAEVGISTNRLHPRGPVGVDGITTYKYKLEGRGHVVSDYTGADAQKFTHKDLPLDGGQVP